MAILLNYLSFYYNKIEELKMNQSSPKCCALIIIMLLSGYHRKMVHCTMSAGLVSQLQVPHPVPKKQSLTSNSRL